MIAAPSSQGGAATDKGDLPIGPGLGSAVGELRRAMSTPTATAPAPRLLDVRPPVRIGSMTVVRGGPVEAWRVDVPRILGDAFGRPATSAEVMAAHQRLDELTEPASAWTRSRLALATDIGTELGNALLNPWPVNYREPDNHDAKRVLAKVRPIVVELIEQTGTRLAAGKVFDQIRPGGELRWLVRLVHNREPGPEHRAALRNFIIRKSGYLPSTFRDPE